jgi:hypothetical protein
MTQRLRDDITPKEFVRAVRAAAGALSLSNAAQYPEVAALFAPASEPEESLARLERAAAKFGTAPPVLEERDREEDGGELLMRLQPVDRFGIPTGEPGQTVSVPASPSHYDLARLEAIVAAQEKVIEEMEREARIGLYGHAENALKAIAGTKRTRHIDAARQALMEAKEGHP